MENPWVRDGLSYYANLQLRMIDGRIYNVERRLDFVAYHLIKWYHGEEALIEMAYKNYIGSNKQ